MRTKALLLLGLAAIVGCEDTPLEPGDVTVVTPGTPVTVGASGGSLITADELVSLTFPEGALATEVPITVAAVAPTVAGVADWTVAVELGPDGTTFDAPVTLSLALDQAAVPAGVPASALRIYTLGEQGWEEVPGSTASADYVVTADIEHFSAYSVQIAPNTATVSNQELNLEVGETAAYESITFEYRAPSGAVFPAAHQAVRWESSEPAFLQLTQSLGATDAEGKAVSPPLEAEASGTGLLSATIGTVVATVDFAVVLPVPGTYVLQTIGGKSLPTLGTGELVHSMTIVLDESGSCSFTGRAQPEQENPSGTIYEISFQSCSYNLDGTELTITFVDEEGEEGGLTAQLSNGRIVLPILIQDDGDDSDSGEMGEAIFVRT
jgi:hypothetical protein